MSVAVFVRRPCARRDPDSGHPEDRNIFCVPTLNPEAAKMHFGRKEISHTQKNGGRMNVVQSGIVWLGHRGRVLETGWAFAIFVVLAVRFLGESEIANRQARCRWYPWVKSFLGSG